MRRLLCALALLAAPAAHAAPIRVVYDVSATAGSWQPIARADLGRAVEQAALEELSKSGRLRLERAPGPGGAGTPGEYRLTIRSHVLDEAETHTTSLTLESGTAHDLPSLSAARTVALSKLPRGKMLTRIERSAREAARALAASMQAPLSRLSDSTAPAEVDEPFGDLGEAPWQWPEVRVPRGSVGRAEKDLYHKNAQRRQAGLRELTSLALTEASPRHALERCALEHEDSRMRTGCLVALRPLSRRLPPTAQVVVQVFRKDEDGRVRREANDQMLYFSGPSRDAAVQAWLEAASRGRDAGPLEDLGDLPNLDLTIRRCLEATGKARGYDNKPRFRCIALLEPVPLARRRAILWRFVREMDPSSPYYLKGAGEREGSTGTPWARAVDALLEGIERWDPKLEEILWRRYQRTLSAHAMSVLSGWAAPSEALKDRLLEIVRTKGEGRALSGLVRIAEADPELKPAVVSALEEMLAMGTFSKDVSESRLERAVKTLQREPRR